MVTRDLFAVANLLVGIFALLGCYQDGGPSLHIRTTANKCRTE